MLVVETYEFSEMRPTIVITAVEYDTFVCRFKFLLLFIIIHFMLYPILCAVTLQSVFVIFFLTTFTLFLTLFDNLFFMTCHIGAIGAVL